MIDKLFELGIAGAILAVLVWVINRFTGIISNHITDSTAASQRLSDVVEELHDWLKYRNGLRRSDDGKRTKN